MTHPQSSQDMQRQLREMMHNDDAVGLGLCSAGFYKSLQDDLSAISSYMAALKADHKAMREAIDFACNDCSCSDCEENVREALEGNLEIKPCGKHYRLQKALSSLQVHE